MSRPLEIGPAAAAVRVPGPAWGLALGLALLFAAGLRASGPGAASSLTPSAVPAPGSAAVPSLPARGGLAGTLALGVDSGRGAVEACLGSLDGGLLSLALARAARAGRPLRLVLDPDDAASRAVGRSLRYLSPAAVHLRWLPGLGGRPRLLVVEPSQAWTWAPDGATPTARAADQARPDFGRAWALALPALPPDVALDDALKALPDPRDQAPHYTRRASAGAPGAAP